MINRAFCVPPGLLLRASGIWLQFPESVPFLIREFARRWQFALRNASNNKFFLDCKIKPTETSTAMTFFKFRHCAYCARRIFFVLIWFVLKNKTHAGTFVYLIKFDDVRMVQPLHDFHFSVDFLEITSVQLRFVYYLDGNLKREMGV